MEAGSKKRAVVLPKADGAARVPSSLTRRIADGSHAADAHALARSFLEYLERLAGPA